MILKTPERIRELRDKHELTQSALARRMGITRSSVNAWEMGVSKPSLENLKALSRIFHTSTDFLLGCNNKDVIYIDDYTVREKELLMCLISYIEGQHEIQRKLKK